MFFFIAGLFFFRKCMIYSVLLLYYTCRQGLADRFTARTWRLLFLLYLVLLMQILFDGIPLDKMSVSMTMNGAVLPVLAM